MATITELATSRPQDIATQGDKSSATLRYLVEINISSETEVTAVSLVNSTAPSAYLGFDKKKTRLTEAKGAGIFEFEVSYDSRDTQKSGDETFGFDVSDLSEKAFYSLVTKHTYRIDGNPDVDFKGGINVTQHGVEGVDLSAHGALKLEVTKTFASADMTADYITMLKKNRGKINNGSWTFTAAGLALTFLEGEARFVGARGGFKQDKGQYEAMLSFAIQENIDADTLGNDFNIGEITVNTKRGWDYLWVSFRQDTNNGVIVQIAEQVNIEQVYKEADFDDFGL